VRQTNTAQNPTYLPAISNAEFLLPWGYNPKSFALLEEKFYVPAGITVIVTWHFIHIING
jgi:hypothetical protein